MKRVAPPLLAFGLSLAAPAPLWAESYCVACFDPDAVYRCVVAGALDTAPPDPRNQIQCVKQLAKAGGHARCSVERFSAAGCAGPERTINPATAVVPTVPTPPPPADTPAPGVNEKDGAAGPAGNTSAPQAAAPESDAAEALPPAPTEPPRTVEELAKTTVESTKKGLDDVTGAIKDSTEKAGDQVKGVGGAMGEAAQKSWNCLTSFFSDC